MGHAWPFLSLSRWPPITSTWPYRVTVMWQWQIPGSTSSVQTQPLPYRSWPWEWRASTQQSEPLISGVFRGPGLFGQNIRNDDKKPSPPLHCLQAALYRVRRAQREAPCSHQELCQCGDPPNHQWALPGDIQSSGGAQPAILTPQWTGTCCE